VALEISAQPSAVGPFKSAARLAVDKLVLFVNRAMSALAAEAMRARLEALVVRSWCGRAVLAMTGAWPAVGLRGSSRAVLSAAYR
jgi:hypothetical protein